MGKQDGLSQNSPGTVAAAPGAAAPGSAVAPGAAETLAGWLEGLPEEERASVAGLFEAETQGLRSALKAEREARGGLEKRLRELAREAEASAPVAAAQIEALTGDLAAAQRRVAFYEGAPADLWNSRLGWLAAQELGAFDAEGHAEWDALREAFPELFGGVHGGMSRVGAGAGAGSGDHSMGVDMNTAIRRAAGRRK